MSSSKLIALSALNAKRERPHFSCASYALRFCSRDFLMRAYASVMVSCGTYSTSLTCCCCRGGVDDAFFAPPKSAPRPFGAGGGGGGGGGASFFQNARVAMRDDARRASSSPRAEDARRRSAPATTRVGTTAEANDRADISMTRGERRDVSARASRVARVPRPSTRRRGTFSCTSGRRRCDDKKKRRHRHLSVERSHVIG